MGPWGLETNGVKTRLLRFGVWVFFFFVCSLQPVFVCAGVHGGEHAWVSVTPPAAPAPWAVPAWVSGGCFPPPVHTFGRRLG